MRPSHGKVESPLNKNKTHKSNLSFDAIKKHLNHPMSTISFNKQHNII